MKLKIISEGNDHSFEGRVKIANSLKKHFKKQLSEDPDVINIHSSGFIESLDKIKKPTVYSLHTNIKLSFFKDLKDNVDNKKIAPEYFSLAERTKKLLLRTLSIKTPIKIKKKLLEKFDVVVVSNNFQKELLQLKNVKVIRYGIDLKKFKPKKIQTKKPVIAYFGHLSASKGIIELIDAFSKIEGWDKRLYLTNSTKKLEEYIKIKDSTIKIMPKIKDIPSAYNSVDVIVLPLRHELSSISTPLVLLEAMACGKAIIASKIRNIEDAAGNTVLYSKANNPGSIIRQINKFSSKKIRDEYGKKARQRAEKYFDENTMFKEYKKIFEKIK